MLPTMIPRGRSLLVKNTRSARRILSFLPHDAMHKRGCSRHAVSVHLSVTFMDHVKTNKYIFKFFSPSGSHTILVFPYQMGWRYSDGNPPNRGVECSWGMGRNHDSGLIAGYRRLLDVRVPKTFTDVEAEYMTQSARHHWLSIDCWTCELQSDKNSYRRPCSVDRTVSDSPANVWL